MLGGLLQGWAAKRYRSEAAGMLAHLRDLNDHEMGLVLAIVAHHRNALIKDGVALRDLTALVRREPMYHRELTRAAGVLAKHKRAHDVLAINIWVHSLRGALDKRGLGDDVALIWRELERGRPHIAKAREEVKQETGFELDVSGAGETPKEFVRAR